MLSGNFKVPDLKRFLEIAIESIRERQAKGTEQYDLTFSLQLTTPREGVSSSQTLSDLDKVLDAVSKFSSEDSFQSTIALFVHNAAQADLGEEVRRKYEAAAALAVQPKKLITA